MPNKTTTKQTASLTEPYEYKI